MQEEKKQNGAPPKTPPDYVGTFDPMTGDSGPPTYQASPTESGSRAFGKRREKNPQEEEHPA